MQKLKIKNQNDKSKFKIKRLIRIFLVSFLSFLYIFNFVYAGEFKSVIEGKYCKVFYGEDINLEKVNRRINLGFTNFYRSRKDKKNVSPEEILVEKFDALFMRVQDILDMHPKRTNVAINIYKNKDGLDRIYGNFFNEPNKAISFYIYKTNVIYTTEYAITEKILAHEMAHCIIDHYFVILPPRKVQEILAAYADYHLKD